MTGKFGKVRAALYPLFTAHGVDWTAKEEPTVKLELDTGERGNGGGTHYLAVEMSADEARALGNRLIEHADNVTMTLRRELEDV